MYPTGDMREVIAAFPGRSAAAVKLRAQKDGLCRPPATPQGSLERLLEDSPTAAYWIGFLMADGHFSDRRLSLRVGVSDLDHVRTFAAWLGPGFRVSVERNGTIASLSCQQPASVAALRARFDLSSRKTYEPPSRLPYASDELLAAWLIGLIDGDGTIKVQVGRRGAFASVVAHASWLPLFELVTEQLGLGRVGTRRGGEKNLGTYAALSISAHPQMVALKQFGETRRLPVLERKWAKVDETFVPRTVRAAQARALVMAGGTPRDLVERLGYTPHTAYVTVRRLQANRPHIGTS